MIYVILQYFSQYLDPLVSFIKQFGTPISALVLAYQIWQRKRQFTTEFEDSLTDEYRDIVYEIPIEERLSNGESDGKDSDHDIKDYYKYFDLTNQQIFLRKEGRVSKSTWESWREGIESNMQKESFDSAWEEINKKSDSKDLESLKRFLDNKTGGDPRLWLDPGREQFLLLLPTLLEAFLNKVLIYIKLLYQILLSNDNKESREHDG
jgi:hypothetical protein